MNLAIDTANGKIYFYTCPHMHSIENDYFIKLVENIEELNADSMGGVLVTDVKNKNTKSTSIKEVLMHKFGVGNASFRIG